MCIDEEALKAAFYDCVRSLTDDDEDEVITTERIKGMAMLMKRLLGDE